MRGAEEGSEIQGDPTTTGKQEGRVGLASKVLVFSTCLWDGAVW